MKRPKKSLSQNFLIDKNISKKILKYTNIRDKTVLEIGPGYGFMTDSIVEKKPNKLYLIEKDFDLINHLNKKYEKNKNIILIEEDILKYNLNHLKDLVIISNLPYNISTKVILYLFDFNKNIKEMIFMVQKEVADKFNYNSKNMNKYKFLTKTVCNYSKCFDVTSHVFFPKPKVLSSVVKFKFKKGKLELENAKKFSNVIFKNIRKKINNNVKIKSDNYLLNKRINELTIDELLTIYNLF